ncbi:MAG: D-aminoacyl-tRNA deacylase [Breznakia sp.]
MKVVIQRVKHAHVKVDNQLVARIQKGFLLLVGIAENDDKKQIEKFVRKITQMRIFEDENAKMNRSLQEVGGAILSISQFTLYADCKKGNRPSFIKAAKSEHAQALYDMLNAQLKATGMKVETGVFGAHMEIDLCNDGPTTIILDSEEL